MARLYALLEVPFQADSPSVKLKNFLLLALVTLFAACASPKILCFPLALGDTPKLTGVGQVMQKAVDDREISGAVTVVVTKDKILHLEATGLADMAAKKPMQPDSVFWIASMTTPIT